MQLDQTFCLGGSCHCFNEDKYVWFVCFFFFPAHRQSPSLDDRSRSSTPSVGGRAQEVNPCVTRAQEVNPCTSSQGRSASVHSVHSGSPAGASVHSGSPAASSGSRRKASRSRNRRRTNSGLYIGAQRYKPIVILNNIRPRFAIINLFDRARYYLGETSQSSLTHSKELSPLAHELTSIKPPSSHKRNSFVV